MIEPILTYACEVWGYENIAMLENLYLKFLKRILKLRKSTPNYMVFGETGRFPLTIKIKKRIVSFWIKLVHSPNKLSNLFYRLLLNSFNNGYAISWTKNLKEIFDSLGYSNIWITQGDGLNEKWVVKTIERKLQDQFIQKWEQDINNSSKGLTYKIIKTSFGYEQYLSILPEYYWSYMLKFRTSNHKLPIESGRWNRTPRDERFCIFCQNIMGDEFHFLFQCKKLKNIRSKYIKERFWKRPNILNLHQLFNSQDLDTLINLSKYIKEGLKCFS